MVYTRMIHITKSYTNSCKIRWHSVKFLFKWLDLPFDPFIELDDGQSVGEDAIVEERKQAGDSAIDRVENLGVQSAPTSAQTGQLDDGQPQTERQERFEVQDQPKAECRPDEGKHMHGICILDIFLTLHDVYLITLYCMLFLVILTQLPARNCQAYLCWHNGEIQQKILGDICYTWLNDRIWDLIQVPLATGWICRAGLVWLFYYLCTYFYN